MLVWRWTLVWWCMLIWWYEDVVWRKYIQDELYLKKIVNKNDDIMHVGGFYFDMMHVDMMWSIMCSRCCWRNMLKMNPSSCNQEISFFVYVCLCLWCFCLWNFIKAGTSCGQHRPTVLHAWLRIRQGSSCPFHRERSGK